MRASSLKFALCIQVLAAFTAQAQGPDDLAAQNSRLLKLEAELLAQLRRGPQPEAAATPASSPSPADTSLERSAEPVETPQAAVAATGVDHLAELQVNTTPEPKAAAERKDTPDQNQRPEEPVVRAALRTEPRGGGPAAEPLDSGVIQGGAIAAPDEFPGPFEPSPRTPKRGKRLVLEELSRLDASLEELRNNDRQIKRMLEDLRCDVEAIAADVRVDRQGELVHAAAPDLEAPAARSGALIATVVNEPAVLRSAPSRGATRIMSVPRGTRLPVEMHRGSWYRVVTPNGFRAWLPADVLIANSLP